MSKNRKVDNKSAIKKTSQDIPEELQEIEEDLTNYNPEIFKGVPQKKKVEILHSLSVVSIQHRSHSGPLPDPETLIKYNSVIPNGADRIMKMAENQQAHRISIENRVVASQSAQSKLGQVFGLIIGLVGIGCGTFLAATGEPTIGGIIAGGTVVSLVSVFVIGKSAQRKSLEE
ncbi:putative membrane protein [Galbibacter orientalis DSM 19592]|uniref:Putative membrane protein n=1 Tax=Galbibacter orientalis DSM 19592 TaxID=926559 RepID=I3C4I1_9FLAO|nr:DUF2335 domain-containing protein [Galbibacter orientalis]EIJ38524.1 putative membrane protein [Galbibacter orientalis DSM 19592]